MEKGLLLSLDPESTRVRRLKSLARVPGLSDAGPGLAVVSQGGQPGKPRSITGPARWVVAGEDGPVGLAFYPTPKTANRPWTTYVRGVGSGKERQEVYEKKRSLTSVGRPCGGVY